MKIIELPNQILRQKSLKVKFPLREKDLKIAQDLINYLKKAENPDNDLREGVGIAAVQLGYLKRMFYVRFTIAPNQTFEELLINPEITWSSKELSALEKGEGCLSIDEQHDVDGLVHRKKKIKIKGYSYFKKTELEYDLEGLPAIIFQHEYDHLDGRLYVDRIDYLNPLKILKGETII